jgi:hypothetical protein
MQKLKRVRRGTYPPRDDARKDVFAYIKIFYDPKRKHTNNGIPSPVDFATRQQKPAEAGALETLGTSTRLFSRTARSCFSTKFSRRNRFTCACRSTGVSLGATASRSSPSHRVSIDNLIPKFSAISRRVRPLANFSHTASRRNSGVGLVPLRIEHLPVPQLVCSTLTGQVHVTLVRQTQHGLTHYHPDIFFALPDEKHTMVFPCRFDIHSGSCSHTNSRLSHAVGQMR